MQWRQVRSEGENMARLTTMEEPRSRIISLESYDYSTTFKYILLVVSNDLRWCCYLPLTPTTSLRGGFT